MASLQIVQLDNGDLLFTVTDATGSAVDLTSSTIEFRLYEESASVSKVIAACSIVDALAGTCKLTVLSSYFDTVGRYLVDLKITFTGSKLVTGLPKPVIQVVASAPATT
jgi:hypothetical protein